MKIYKVIIYIVFIGIVACKPTSETQIVKISDLGLLTKSGIIYALPKTNLSFKVEAVRTDIIPGPYHEYAEKYIGITDVPHMEESTWQISNITIDSYNDIDADQFYVLHPSGKMNINLNKLIKNEIIFPVNRNIKDVFENKFYGNAESENGIIFKDLSVSKYIGEEKVTYYKRVQRDSLFAKVPVVKTQSVYKSFEDKAEEAAKFIFMIREKRFELLSGMADYYPEGKALEVVIKELARLENEYLDLFIGKRFTSTYSASYEFTPSIKDVEQPYILFRFSEGKGVLTANDLSGRPIIIELENYNQTKSLSNLFPNYVNQDGVVNNDNLYYRVPELAQVKIYDGSSLIATRKVKIDQFGETILFPLMFLMEEESFIEFYYDEVE